MIMKRGEHAETQGFQVNEMVREINERFPAPHLIMLWFVKAEYTHMSEGGPEYGQLKIVEGIHPAMFIAIKDRDPGQVAGTIAYEYAKYLQRELGMPEDNVWAAFFARYLNGNPGFPEGGPIAELYAEKLAPAKC